MKKLIFLILVICNSAAFAQINGITPPQTTGEMRMPAPARKDKPINFWIDRASVDIEGYDGNEIIIEISADQQLPQSDSVMKQILLPYRVNTRDNYHYIQQDSLSLGITLAYDDIKRLHIKVPKSAVIKVVMMAYRKDIQLSVKNVNSVQVGAIIPLISLDGISNFMITSGGAFPGLRASDKIILSNIKFTNEPVIINGKPYPRQYYVGANSASIELGVPLDIKANINFSSENGQVFSNLDIAPAIPSQENIKMFEKDFHHQTGLKNIALNGGGININISNNYGNIYLKKQ